MRKKVILRYLILMTVLIGLVGGSASAAAYIVDLEYANIGAIAPQVYSGEAVCPEVSVEYCGTLLQEGVDYSLDYDDNIQVGTGCVTVTGIAPAVGEQRVCFAIQPADMSDATLSGVRDQTYQSYLKAYTLSSLEVELNDVLLTEGVDYLVRYANNTAVGTASVLVDGIGNYQGRQRADFDILKASNTRTMTLSYSNRSNSISANVGDQIVFYGANNNDGMTSSRDVYYGGKNVSSSSTSSIPYTTKSYSMGSYVVSQAGTYTVRYKVSGYSMVVSGGQYWCRPNSSGTTYSQTIVVTDKQSSSGSVTDVSIAEYAEGGVDKVYLGAEVSVSAAGANSALTWTSSDTGVAQVDSYGGVTLVSPGTCTITASARNGLSDSLILDIASMDLPLMVEDIHLFRREYGYDVTVVSDKGNLRLNKDYKYSCTEEGPYVRIRIEGRGLYSGTVEQLIRRPLLSALGAGIQRDGSLIVEAAPGAFQDSVLYVAATYHEDGQMETCNMGLFSDDTEGNSDVFTPEADPDGTYRVFFLDPDTMTPVAEYSSGLITPPPTKEETEAKDEAARDVYNMMRTYAIENATSTGSIYKSSFTAHGSTGSLWYIPGSSAFTIATKGNGLVINLRVESPGYMRDSFSYDMYVDGVLCYGSFTVDVASYQLNDPVTFVRYYAGDPLTDPELEQEFIDYASYYYAKMVSMLDVFLQENGKDIYAIGYHDLYGDE